MISTVTMPTVLFETYLGIGIVACLACVAIAGWELRRLWNNMRVEKGLR